MLDGRINEALHPGKIDDFDAHSAYLMRRYREFVSMYLDLGGTHLIVGVFSFLGFHNRGPEYAQLATQNMARLIDDDQIAFYHERGIDPYFAGIDVLKLAPPTSPIHQLSDTLAAFQADWPYAEGRHKLVWEIASLPLYSFWQMFAGMDPQAHAALEAEVRNQPDFEAVYDVLYRHYSQRVYGTYIPKPAFYLGTAKSGDLKWRGPMPAALSGGDFLRLFYTPYPSLFTKRQTMQRILEEVVYGKRFFSDQTDYSGRYSRESVQAEYERASQLSDDPLSTLGLARRVTLPDDDDD